MWSTASIRLATSHLGRRVDSGSHCHSMKLVLRRPGLRGARARPGLGDRGSFPPLSAGSEKPVGFRQPLAICYLLPPVASNATAPAGLGLPQPEKNHVPARLPPEAAASSSPAFPLRELPTEPPICKSSSVSTRPGLDVNASEHGATLRSWR